MAIDLDGTDDYLESTTLPVASATYPITMACWFNVDNITASHTLMSLDNDSGGQRLMLQADGALAGDPVVAFAFDTAGSQAASLTPFASGTWHHAVGIFAATNSRTAGIDGVLGTAQVSARSPSWSRLKLGARFSSGLGSFCNGRIAEAALWNAALTADEVMALARGVSPRLVRPNLLRFYAPLVRAVRDHARGITITQNGGVVAVHPRRLA